jgi:hypothetical protein
VADQQGYGYAELPFLDEALYDLVFDPHEAANLTTSEAHSDILEEMRALARMDGGDR